MRFNSSRLIRILHRFASSTTTAINNSFIPEIANQNCLKIQILPQSIHEETFGDNTDSINDDIIIRAKALLKEFNLSTDSLPLLTIPRIQLPKLAGPSLYEHFYLLGLEQSEPYLSLSKKFITQTIPLQPTQWSENPGWTKYKDNLQTKVDYPTGDCLVFDVEVLVPLGHHPIIATAVSSDAWFSWVSPTLFDDHVEPTLISMGPPDITRVVVGHNIGYDRARIREEYTLSPTKTAFIDTMSLHSAVSGLTSQQRSKWMSWNKQKGMIEEDEEIDGEFNEDAVDETLVHKSLDKDKDSKDKPGKKSRKKKKVDTDESLEKIDALDFKPDRWFSETCMKSLQSVSELHLNRKLDKEKRSIFITGSKTDVRDDFQALMKYCATDVKTTFEVFQVLLPKFLVKCPHPVTFAGMLNLSKCFLPVNDEWSKFITNANATYDAEMNTIDSQLLRLAEELCTKYSGNDDYKLDDWYKNLDWTTVLPKESKKKIDHRLPTETLKSTKEQLFAKRAKKKFKADALTGRPAWYRDLWDSELQKIVIKLGMRVTPFLLRISYMKHPLLHHKNHGWFYSCPKNEMHAEPIKDTEPDLKEKEKVEKIPGELEFIPENKNFSAEELKANYSRLHTIASNEPDKRYFKLPHYEGPNNNCGNPLGKSYKKDYDSGILSSENPITLDIIARYRRCGYWTSARGRIESQFMHEDALQPATKIILPLMVPMGTVTRRAVEGTWMTLSNPKKDRIGSEVKSMIRAPPGYSFIGADVDSEELWIASLLGDAQFGIHGATPLGFMTLEGNKQNQTDLHSRTAQILNVSRDDAKIFNYGRIYGAGKSYAARILKLCSNEQDDLKINAVVEELYAKTKGVKRFERGSLAYWSGGSESFMFNILEHIIHQHVPRTPALNCVIPDGLLKENMDKSRPFLTSRINWVVQSSGVDYLHLLIVSMDYLCRRLSIDAKFIIGIHDEVRYMAKDEHKYLAAYALQISNLWIRSYFSSQVGINSLPLSVAFFSSVDIDHCLRKEVTMDCITPSNQIPIPHGISQDIKQTLAMITLSPTMFGKELKSITELKKKERHSSWKVNVPVQQIMNSIAYLDKQINKKT